MKWQEPLDDIVGSRTKVRILRCLWASDGEAFSGREIARRAGLSHTGVLRALEELEEQDVVWPSSDPTGTRYRLNRTSVVVREGLMPLFDLEGSLEQRTADEVRAAIPQAVSIVEFGSVARGEDDARSDVDMLVIVPDDVDAYQAAERIEGVEHYARYGKLLEVVVWTETELRENHQAGVALVASILDHGKLLFGRSLREILLGVSHVSG